MEINQTRIMSIELLCSFFFMRKPHIVLFSFILLHDSCQLQSYVFLCDSIIELESKPPLTHTNTNKQ